ncbi:hypothetical protein CC85DRAFT_287024 [Cutaneotrichosporon oleaginosum]|uniref:Uncharacterized protein n=1 Tax=Cutaneotrichosporon oleaginosum TaxID=879819 RepID=A0A0J0XII8_9TREE|nr:uncharacterized protein CC85DRAFT_287024 [Cutaneotrichosporon oleaginosum]KLT40877.1 hypothetical protein CC85DRAFT_287024 [Cutaneotrichosporon oleaginosum]TXT09264.1 hypothetical protein COLE_03198 [Cutaneotrichosporon oleaginosum]
MSIRLIGLWLWLWLLAMAIDLALALSLALPLPPTNSRPLMQLSNNRGKVPTTCGFNDGGACTTSGANADSGHGAG